MWVLFVVMLTVWLLALIASGFGGLIHSVVTLCKSESQSLPLPPSEPTPAARARG
jgi:hypothetical protein